MKILSYLAMSSARCPLHPRISENELQLHCHFRALHFAKMLLHVATVTMLVNIAFLDLDPFYSRLPAKNLDFIQDEVTSESHRRFSNKVCVVNFVTDNSISQIHVVQF